MQVKQNLFKWLIILFIPDLHKVFLQEEELSQNGPQFNPFSANFTKWSNTFKQFVGNLPTNCLSVFDHFVELAVKGLNYNASKKRYEAFPSLRHNKKAEKN